MALPSLAQIEALLWPEGFRRDMWMVVDAARDRRIFGVLVNSYLDYSCLYSGSLPPALETVAPYLVQLEHEDRYTRELLQQAWGNSWGILIRCDSSLETLRRHLRQFLVVQGPRGERLVFRYYDPRVLRIYLPTCNAEELRTVFGPIECFYTEAEASEEIWEFRRDERRLLPAKTSLADGRAVGLGL
jgi:hypothetical protein